MYTTAIQVWDRVSRIFRDSESSSGNNSPSIPPQRADEVKYVVAFDIGTTYSGYAYQDSNGYKRDPLSISVNSCTSGSLSMKTSTAILFDKEKNCHSFGNRSTKTYACALETGTQHHYSFFKGFKMTLYNEAEVSDALTILNKDGRQMNAMMVFTESIRIMKADAMKDMVARLGEIDEDKVTFVLTVPAIWREPAKQFMRLSAEKAGIKPENLILALEPEAAALYCKALELNSALGTGDEAVQRCFQPGGKYMILDLGGGTIDSVVHGTDDNGDIVELYKSSGGPWGGEYVNVNFISFLEDTYGKDTVNEFREKRCLDYYDLEQEFEVKKRQLDTKTDTDVRLRIPGHMIILANRPVACYQTIDHLYIQKTNFISFFDPLIEKIIQHLESIFKEVGEIPLLFLVGGFSESPYVQEKLKEKFGSTKVLVPKDSGLAIVKGAVLFGFNPVAVKMRKCRFTYGIEINEDFNEAIHPPEKRFIEDGVALCEDIFQILIQEGDSIQFDEEKITENYSSHASDETRHAVITIPVYTSEEKNPSYTTDIGCKKLGEIKVNPPENGWPENKNRYTIKFKFGRTELFVSVHDTTNDRQYDATFDMLG